MSIVIKGAEVPKNCFRCPAKEHYDFGGETHGYRCGFLHDAKVITNVMARESRRSDCPVDAVAPVPTPAADPAPDVLMFIGRFSTDGWETRREVVEAFTRGCCFWFAYILAARFEQQYGAEILTDYVANHFATRIGGRVYDITGDVTEGHKWEPWAECNDAMLRQRIIDGCIMF